MNAEEFYYEDFRFGDKHLSDFNGIIYNEDGWKISSGVTIEKLTEKLPKKHGELFMDYTYNPREITFSVFIEDDIDMDDFMGWLLGGEKEFEFVDSNKVINAIFDNQIDIRAFYDNGFKGLLDLTFIAYNPFWKAKNENKITIDNPKINEIIKIKPLGNTESYPTIKISPNGTQSKVRFKINEDIITLVNVDKDIYIYCENEEVKEVQFGSYIDVFKKYSSNDYYDFPHLEPNMVNTFKLLEGNVTSIQINCNSRWI